ncbi:MAG: hypothetical protein ABIC04_05770 [Nanoarchaeota archaeon]
MDATYNTAGNMDMSIIKMQRTFVPHAFQMIKSVKDVKVIALESKKISIHQKKELKALRKKELQDFVKSEKWEAEHFMHVLKVLSELIGNIFYDIDELVDILRIQKKIDITAESIKIPKDVDQELQLHYEREHKEFRDLMKTIANTATAMRNKN